MFQKTDKANKAGSMIQYKGRILFTLTYTKPLNS